MERSNEITLIVGKKGCGKSCRARELALKHNRRIYLDTMHEHTDGVIVRSYDALIEYLRPRVHQSYSVILRTLDEEEALAALALATATDNPERAPLPGVLYIVDEADRYMSATSMPDSVQRMANYGRHFRVSAIFVARRAKRLPMDLRAAADRIVVGRTVEPSDVGALAEYIGEELAQQVREIPEARPGEAPVMVEWRS